MTASFSSPSHSTPLKELNVTSALNAEMCKLIADIGHSHRIDDRTRRTGMQTNGFFLFGVLADHEPNRINTNAVSHDPLCTEVLTAPFCLIDYITVSCIDDRGIQPSRDVIVLSRKDVTMETLGLTLAESKQLLHMLQQYMVEQQATAYFDQHRACPRCGASFVSHGHGRRRFNTVFGPTSIPNPRWGCCTCESEAGKTFRPTANWLTGRSSPEWQYLEAKWASLIPYAKVVDLLKDVLPVSRTLNSQTVCNHLQAAATKLEQALGEEQECLFSGSEDDWATQPLPWTHDGGPGRRLCPGRRKDGFFEVIAGKSVVAFTRECAEAHPSTKRFAFVQTCDTKPRRRLWELMKSQGMQENQQLLFLSDGGDIVRNLQVYLHPSSEHVLDWFHVTMRLTVMNQQTKGVAEEDAALGAEIAQSLESVKHTLWHGTWRPHWSV